MSRVRESICLSNVYALVEFQGKLLVWNNIHLVRSLFPYLPWIIAGDFNAITDLAEKRGGNARLEPSAMLFRDNISSLNLVDIKPSNGQFTWNNKRVGDSCIVKRLNHFMISYFWVGGLWSSSSKILDWRGSNHWPIKLVISST